MLTWHYLSSTVYHAADVSEKTSDKLFFLSDTHEIYKGTENYTAAVIVYDTEPATKAINKLYINKNTLEGKVWDGSAWITVIQPVQTTLTSTDTSMPVSGKAVADYVSEQIQNVTGSDGLVAGVTYNKDTTTLNVAMANGDTNEVQLTDIAVDLVYDKNSGLLQVKDATGTAIGTGINLDLERFVSEASYDHETGVITLKFNDDGDPLTIDIGDLVDTYTAENSSTINLTVTGNKFKAEAIVASTAGNMLQATDSGLYVAATDISGKMDKDTDAVENNVAIFDANGNAVDSGKTVGGATISASPNANTLATEAAVEAIRTALNTSIDGKISKVASATVGDVAVLTSDGSISDSGVKIGVGVSSSSTAGTLATEKGVYDFVSGYAVAKTNVTTSMAETTTAASDDKVPSEKAVVDALTWKTTV